VGGRWIDALFPEQGSLHIAHVLLPVLHELVVEHGFDDALVSLMLGAVLCRGDLQSKGIEQAIADLLQRLEDVAVAADFAKDLWRSEEVGDPIR